MVRTSIVKCPSTRGLSNKRIEWGVEDIHYFEPETPQPKEESVNWEWPDVSKGAPILTFDDLYGDYDDCFEQHNALDCLNPQNQNNFLNIAAEIVPLADRKYQSENQYIPYSCATPVRKLLPPPSPPSSPPLCEDWKFAKTSPRPMSPLPSPGRRSRSPSTLRSESELYEDSSMDTSMDTGSYYSESRSRSRSPSPPVQRGLSPCSSTSSLEFGVATTSILSPRPCEQETTAFLRSQFFDLAVSPRNQDSSAARDYQQRSSEQSHNDKYSKHRNHDTSPPVDAEEYIIPRSAECTTSPRTRRRSLSPPPTVQECRESRLPSS